MLGFIPHSFPPRKRGPGSRAGAAVAERTSAQWLCQRRAAWRPMKSRHPQRSAPSAGTMLGFIPHSFPPRKRGPRSRGGAAVAERTSAQWVLHRHDAWMLMKRRHLLCCGGPGGLMSSWLPSRARWSLGPGVRRENEGEESEGLGTAVVPLSQNGPHDRKSVV